MTDSFANGFAHKKSLQEGCIGIFGFAVSANVVDRFFGFVERNFRFSVLMTIAVSILFLSRFFAFVKNNIGFSGFLFDVVWCFPGFSSENMRLNDLSRIHAFSNFVCGFRHIPLFKIARSSKLTICTKSLFQ